MKGRLFSDPKLQGTAFFGLGLGCFLLAGLIVFFYSGRFSDRPSGLRAGPALSVSAADKKTANQEEIREEQIKPPGGNGGDWVVYITGAVKAPGVYSVPPGSRVVRLVEAAGGLLPGADPVSVNLAAPLADGAHVHVFPAGTGEGGGGAAPQLPPRDESFARPSPVPWGTAKDGLVRVNSASFTELQRLPGVGPALARAIIEQRARVGRFSSLGDLLKVRGIGPKKLEDMRFHVDLQ